MSTLSGGMTLKMYPHRAEGVFSNCLALSKTRIVLLYARQHKRKGLKEREKTSKEPSGFKGNKIKPVNSQGKHPWPVLRLILGHTTPYTSGRSFKGRVRGRKGILGRTARQKTRVAGRSRMDELTVDTLVEALQEPNRRLLTQVLRHVGQDRATAILAEALACEASSGMLTRDGTRRRTPGGTFFQLVKDQLTGKVRWKLFAPKIKRRAPRTPQKRQAPAVPWTEVEPAVQALATHRPGEARVVKLTLIGRPGKVEKRGQAVVFRIQGKRPDNFPRGLPEGPTQPLTWTVVVVQRQWNRVEAHLAADNEDQLIIEGYPAMQGKEHVLLAQSCTSVALQRAQKAAQREEAAP